jgi:hypothetical protein
MERVAIVPYSGRIKTALTKKNGDQLWFVIGKNTTWDDNDSVQSPALGATSVTEPIVAVKPVLMSMAKDISEAEYNTLLDNQRAIVVVDNIITYLQLVADEDAYSQIARRLYLRTVINPASGQPGKDFRQIGIFSGLVPAAGYEANDWLLPEHIDDYGMLEYLDNGDATKMDATGPIIVIAVALEFE